jgi:hypothetical protein
MSLMIDLRPEPDTWWRRLKEATVERYRDWRFDRDIDQIHAALDRLSSRQLEMIGCRRDRLLEDVYRLVHNHAAAEWCNRPLPLAAWVPPLNGRPEGGALTTIPRERLLEAA